MTCNHGPAPSPAVLQAFGLSGTPIPLAGGQGECYILTDSTTQQKTILKPALNLEETEFLSSLQASLHALQPQGYRIAKPVSLLKHNTEPPLSYTALTSPTPSQSIIAWTAAHHLPGQGDPTVNLPSLLPASRALHASLLTLYPPSTPPPPYIANRTDRWAHGDRFAWGELTLSTIPSPVSRSLIASPLGPWLTRLQALLAPLTGLLSDPDPNVSRPQVIHGDLSGNLLFDYVDDNDEVDDPLPISSATTNHHHRPQRSPPAIIDISPFHRPAAYAEAIVGIDLLLWRKGTLADLHRLDPDDLLLRSRGRVQLLVRAALFRLVTFAIDADEGFVGRNLPLLDGEGAVRALEALVQRKGEGEVNGGGNERGR